MSNHSLTNYSQGNGLVLQKLTSESHQTFTKSFQRCVPYSTIETWMKPTSLKTCWTIYHAQAEKASKRKSWTMSANKILLYALVLLWYVEHSLEVTALYRTIDHNAKKLFKWFVKQVTEVKRTGDVDREKAWQKCSSCLVTVLTGNSLKQWNARPMPLTPKTKMSLIEPCEALGLIPRV